MTELTKQDLLSLGLDPVTIDRVLQYTKIYKDDDGLCHYVGDISGDPCPIDELKDELEKLMWDFLTDLNGHAVEHDYFIKAADSDLLQAILPLYDKKTPQQLFDGYQACHFLIYGKRFPDR